MGFQSEICPTALRGVPKFHSSPAEFAHQVYGAQTFSLMGYPTVLATRLVTIRRNTRAHTILSGGNGECWLDKMHIWLLSAENTTIPTDGETSGTSARVTATAATFTLPGTQVTNVPGPLPGSFAIAVTITNGPTTPAGVLMHGWEGTLSSLPTDICRLFGIPPHMVGIIEPGSKSTTEHQSLEVSTNTYLGAG